MRLINMNIDWDSLVSVTTAVGVFIAAFQLRTSSKIAQSEFEDSIDQQYRDLARGIPVDALIGKSVSEDKKEMTRELIYNYLDCLLYTSPSPRDLSTSRMPSSA